MKMCGIDGNLWNVEICGIYGILEIEEIVVNGENRGIV